MRAFAAAENVKNPCKRVSWLDFDKKERSALSMTMFTAHWTSIAMTKS